MSPDESPCTKYVRLDRNKSPMTHFRTAARFGDSSVWCGVWGVGLKIWGFEIFSCVYDSFVMSFPYVVVSRLRFYDTVENLGVVVCVSKNIEFQLV